MKKIEILGAITGSILGDGYARNNQLTIQHSIKQKDYLLYKARLLNQSKGSRFVLTEKLDITYPYIRLFYHNKSVGRARKKIYVNGTKVLTEGILNQLGTIGLAIWYMDDGSLVLHKYPNGTIKSREVYWSTDNFDLDSHLTFQKWMKRKYDIDIKITPYKKGKYYRTVLNATNANKFFELIKAHIPPSMEYKINMCYSDNPLRTRRPSE